MFEINFQDPSNPGELCYAWQNSWGLSTRSIGAMVMIHGDDRGLVLPPRVAEIQVVIVPVGITAKTADEDKHAIYERARAIAAELRVEKIRVEVDDRDNVTPPWKFNHWELKGVPLRLELGPKDLKEDKVVAVVRYNGEKRPLNMTGILPHVDEVKIKQKICERSILVYFSCSTKFISPCSLGTFFHAYFLHFACARF